MGLISRVSSRTYRKLKIKKMQIFVRGTETHTLEVNSQQELLDFVCKVEEANASELMLSVNGAPIDFSALEANQTVDISGKLLGGRVHGSLARAGKVKGQTPKVEKEEKKKKKTGGAKKRIQYNRRYVNVVTGFGKKRGPNSNADKV